jgi:hypothetical protein
VLFLLLVVTVVTVVIVLFFDLFPSFLLVLLRGDFLFLLKSSFLSSLRVSLTLTFLVSRFKSSRIGVKGLLFNNDGSSSIKSEILLILVLFQSILKKKDLSFEIDQEIK